MPKPQSVPAHRGSQSCWRILGRVFLIFPIILGIACGGGSKAPKAVGVPPADPQTDIRRFLTQATFGVTEGDVQSVAASGYPAWLDAQFAQPVSASAVSYMDARSAQLQADPRGFSLGPGQFYEFFYRNAATAPDQLRQRVAFALSQICVISMRNDIFVNHSRQAGAYYDMLAADAFGNFRTLLEDVTLQPGMGFYLSSIWNLPDQPGSTRIPDENYAREVMQLMSIGLDQLNPDGTARLDGQGQPVPTYSHADVAGLAKVFTGFGWYAPFPTDTTFWGGVGSDSDVNPMTLYPDYHSTSSKSFLGTTLAAGPADPAGDLEAALDTLFNHPNVGPFVALRLIQRLVTSNPSPAYVGRVAAAFADNGKGVRGDLRAVVRAVLLDPEARDLALARAPGYGKLREPVLRLTQWMRAFSATSQSGDYLLGNTDAESYGLAQSPLTAPSVFNFWRPDYAPALPAFAGSALAAPEYQVVDAVSVAGYLNFMQDVVDQGCGGGAYSSPATDGPDIRAAYAAETALAGDPGALASRLDLLLLNGTMTGDLRRQIVETVASVAIPDPPAAAAQARLDRVKLAVFLTLASPEFLHQR